MEPWTSRPTLFDGNYNYNDHLQSSTWCCPTFTRMESSVGHASLTCMWSPSVVLHMTFCARMGFAPLPQVRTSSDGRQRKSKIPDTLMAFHDVKCSLCTSAPNGIGAEQSARIRRYSA